MIDEKKLIEDILQHENVLASANHVYKSGYRDRQDEIIDIIKRQPKAGEWMPVSEMLPNINGIVLVQRGTYAECKGKPIIDIAKFTNRKTGFFEREKGFYQAWYSMPFKYDDVIAWQPLPEPYKGELV